MSELKERVGQPPRVTLTIGFTKNVGNYESLRVDVGLSADCNPGETPDQTFERVSQWCEDTLVEEVNRLTEGLEEGK